MLPKIKIKVSYNNTALKKTLTTFITSINNEKLYKVGYRPYSGKLYENGKTVAEIAAKHEYGIQTPRRPIIGSVITHRKDYIIQRTLSTMRQHGWNGYSLKDREDIFAFIAFELHRAIVETFDTQGFGTWPPLSQYTIEQKGHSNILIDTQTLRRSSEIWSE